MERYKGVTVCEGVAIGPAYVMRANKEKARFTEDDDDAVMSAPGRVQSELLRLERALEKTRVRMDKMVLDAGVKAGGTVSDADPSGPAAVALSDADRSREPV